MCRILYRFLALLVRLAVRSGRSKNLINEYEEPLDQPRQGFGHPTGSCCGWVDRSREPGTISCVSPNVSQSGTKLVFVAAATQSHGEVL